MNKINPTILETTGSGKKVDCIKYVRNPRAFFCRLFYNFNPFLIFSFILFIILFVILRITDDVVSLVLFCVDSLYIILLLIKAVILSRNFNCIIISKGLLINKYVWINQYVHKIKKKNMCLKSGFKRDVLNIYNNLSPGTVGYCCTHNSIVKTIYKYDPNAKCIIVKPYNMNKIKDKLKNSMCDDCKFKEKCSLFTNKTTNFYAIKFTKN